VNKFFFLRSRESFIGFLGGLMDPVGQRGEGVNVVGNLKIIALMDIRIYCTNVLSKCTFPEQSERI